MFSTSFNIGSLTLSHRLIQGPLAGYSCAPFRELFSYFTQPAYCVSEMLSAHDVVNKHTPLGRYLYRSPLEGKLAYQIAGTDAQLMTDAAAKLQALGADLIDINCGCPKNKIRKNKAGSALLEDPKQLSVIIQRVRRAISCPLTVKMRIVESVDASIALAKCIADAGADALIVHGRHWTHDYDTPCDFQHIAAIKQAIAIPVIANGDIADTDSLNRAFTETGCDAYMIGRAGTGKPWLFAELLAAQPQRGLLTAITAQEPLIRHCVTPSPRVRGEGKNEQVCGIQELFMRHLNGLAQLESEYQAVLQSRSLVRYYFKNQLSPNWLQEFNALTSLHAIEVMINRLHSPLAVIE